VFVYCVNVSLSVSVPVRELLGVLGIWDCEFVCFWFVS
jgi:hypothetical protein